MPDDSPTSSPSLLPPTARVVKNDQKILDAIAQVLVGDGWSRLTLAAIARTAGLSNRPVRSRFADPSAAAAGAWRYRLGGALVDRLEGMLTSAGLLDSNVQDEQFLEGLLRFAAPDSAMSSAAELVVVAHYTPALYEAIDESLGLALRAWAGGTAAENDPVRAAQRAFLCAELLGLVLSAHRRQGYHPDFEPVGRALLTRFAEPAPVITLPPEPARATTDTPEFGSGDPALESLLTATIELIIAHGFDGATTAAIAQRAGFTEGFLFSRYTTKAALFADALARLQAWAIRGNLEIMSEVRAHHGAAYAEAIAYRDGLLADRHKSRVVALEYERVSARHHDLATDVARQTAHLIRHFTELQPDLAPQHVEAAVFAALASSLGSALLPLYLPSAVQLPFSVMLQATEAA